MGVGEEVCRLLCGVPGRKYVVLVVAVASTTLAILFLSRVPGLSSPYYQTTTYISTFVFGGAAAFVVRRRLWPRIWSGPMPLFGLLHCVTVEPGDCINLTVVTLAGARSPNLMTA
jgi:peptidoglycan/LPS O-acetylase OafA/YrhL